MSLKYPLQVGIPTVLIYAQFNPNGFGTSKLLTSVNFPLFPRGTLRVFSQVKPKQETRPKILGFNVGLKHTPEPIGSQSPQNHHSASFSDTQNQLIKNRSPTNKPPQMGGGIPVSFVHPRRAYAPERTFQLKRNPL